MIRFLRCRLGRPVVLQVLFLLGIGARGVVAASVEIVYVSASEPASEPISNVASLAAYGVAAPVAIDRIEVDGTQRIAVGDPVGPVAGATWASLTLLGFSHSGNGHLLVSGFLAGTAPSQSFATVIHGLPSGPALLLQQGVTVADGTGGIHFAGGGDGRINTAAGVALHTYLESPPADCLTASPTYDCEGIWAGDPTALVLVARAGDAALDVPGASYDGFGTVGRNPVVLNRYGQLAFVARLRGGTVSTGNDTAIYQGHAGSIALVAREGSPAPGGGNYGQLAEPSLGRYGGLVFLATSAGGAAAIYLDGDRVVATGEAAPRGGTFESLSFPALDDQVAFRAEVLDGSLLDSYLTRWQGQLVEVVREGDVAPETGGETFVALDSNAVINGCGNIPFTAQLSNGLRGLWIYGSDGAGQLLALEGQPSPAGPAYTGFLGYLVDRAARTNLGDGGYRYLHPEAAQVVFRASLADGSTGVFRATELSLECQLLFEDGFESGDTSLWQGPP